MELKFHLPVQAIQDLVRYLRVLYRLLRQVCQPPPVHLSISIFPRTTLNLGPTLGSLGVEVSMSYHQKKLSKQRRRDGDSKCKERLSYSCRQWTNSTTIFVHLLFLFPSPRIVKLQQRRVRHTSQIGLLGPTIHCLVHPSLSLIPSLFHRFLRCLLLLAPRQDQEFVHSSPRTIHHHKI